MSFLKDVIAFERSALRDHLGKIKENPERLLIGAGDPISSKVWGKALGKDYEPLVDQMGGAPKDAYTNAEARGIDTRAGAGMHQVARTIAATYAGNYAAGKLGYSGDGVSVPNPENQAADPAQQRSVQKQALIARAQQIRSRIDALRGRPQVEATQEEPVKMADGGQVTKADLVLENLRSYGVL